MKKLAAILFSVALAVPALAQGKFGADSAECIKYLSYYSEYVKQNNLEEAAPSWRKAISICPPTARQGMFIDGAKILRREIGKPATAERRQELIDSLMMLHDVRAEYYPKYYAAAFNAKAIDVINYYKNDKKKSYDLLSGIISDIKSACSPAVYVNYMQLSVDLFKDGVITAEGVMNDYSSLSEYIEGSKDKNIASAKLSVETIFADSGVASCENLIALYTPRYEAASTDKTVLSNIVKMLTKSDCLSEDLYLKAVESLYSVDPSRESAYFLYKLYSSRDEGELAAKALNEAIGFLDPANPADAGTYADYSLELATFCFKKLGQSANAVQLAKRVPDYNPELAGKAYLLIGTIWGSQKCSGNEIEIRAPFWVACDYMKKAKDADPSLTADADNLSAQYRKYFPQQAEAFMFDVIDGARYTVECNGMRETTTVRTSK